MKRRIYLGFLWHMHQPYYRDPLENIYILPWVRLHAVNAYYTMPMFASEFEHLRMTYNLVPSLIEQLEDYVNGDAHDLYEYYSRLCSDDLCPADKVFILRNFFMANWETMIRPHKRYNDLLLKRGFMVQEQQLDDIAETFSKQEILDLQTWFNLAWLGPAAKDENPEIGKLFKKGRFFNEEEKNYIINYQYEIIRKVIPVYRKLLEERLAELTISPFYHPILPLLCDSNIAADAHPGVKLPARYEYPEDADAQISLAMEKFEHAFGQAPSGMWPSEGSVSLEVVSLAKGAGINWVATDEEILLKSLRGDNIREEVLYRPYNVETETGDIALFFRDKVLSDLIGFTYSRNRPEDAVEDFISKLKQIADSAPGDKDHLFVSVILDGENPWETFPEGGRYFLKQFFKALQDEEWIETTTFSSFLEQHPPEDRIERLAPGSWISGNFDIWIGKNEANSAWDSLGRARAQLMHFLDERGDEDPALREEILRSIYRAEGSDWFWWFDDDFTTETEMEFDYLFRKHLSWAFLTLGQAVPDFLNEPIKSSTYAAHVREPTDFIKPVIDGEITHYYEWANAGVYDIEEQGSAMYNSQSFLKGIFFGFDERNLYLRFDPLPEPDAGQVEEFELTILFLEIEKMLSFNWSKRQGHPKSFVLCDQVNEKNKSPRPKTFETICASRIIELAIPFGELGLTAGEEVKFVISICRDGLELKRYPSKGFISFNVPDESFHLKVWSV